MTIPQDRMLYLVISEHPTGPLIHEQSLSDMDRKTVEQDVRHGQFGDVIAVWELNAAEGICREVTDEFREAIDRCSDDA